MPVFEFKSPVASASANIKVVTTSVSAGFPSPAADDLEDEIDPIAWVVRHPTSTFWWRVEGNCLWDVGIRDGDLIAVDRAGKRRVGRAVLAVVDGAVTAKILRKRNDRYFLAPANTQEHFPDIELNEDSEIWGVIAGCGTALSTGMKTPIAISDSANFYVSAERLFEPSLKNTPVIVLSNNDGCAVARSDEAKALGIKMGAPFHKLKDVISKHGVRVFSSNYTALWRY